MWDKIPAIVEKTGLYAEWDGKEQLLRVSQSTRSDIQIGSVLYHLTTGKAISTFRTTRQVQKLLEDGGEMHSSYRIITYSDHMEQVNNSNIYNIYSLKSKTET
jgi:hypothetical protein